MLSSHASHNVIAHFDRPLALCTSPSTRTTPPRGILWVTKWAAAIGILVCSVTVLTEFAYLVGAEQTLTRAARAGLVEATLPRASFQTVNNSIERRLETYPGLASRLRLSLTQNAAPIAGRVQLRDSDRLAITLAVDTDAALPGWLKTMRFWRGGSQLQVHVDRDMPSRTLGRSVGGVSDADLATSN